MSCLRLRQEHYIKTTVGTMNSRRHHTNDVIARIIKWRNIRTLVIIAATMIVGVAVLILSHASSPTASIQPEDGTLGGQAAIVNDGSASGGKTIKFKAPSLPNCPYTAPVAANQWGAMTYVNYTFNQPDIYQVAHEIDVINNPSSTSDFYIQLYDANIGASGQYYGIQTTGFVIWSRWGTNDTSNIRPGPGAVALNGVETGSNFISLRKDHGSLPSGHYKTRIVRAEFDGVGDWFQYYVTFPGQSEEHIGDMRFPRKTAGVQASFSDGGGQWNEFWDNNGSSLKPVPLLQLNVKITVDGWVTAAQARGHYSPMPNSDMYVLDTPGGYIHYDMGSTTGRCHPGDANNDLNLW